MITKFSLIKNFGSFLNFDWDSTVTDHGNNVVYFNKLNIIYGRNYSGKTTLSRVLRSFKKKEIHEDYPNANFIICDSEHGEFCECDLEACAVDIRVYNSDFVEENLKLLRDKNGKIRPFAVVGSKNVEIEKQIDSLVKEIGDEESGLTKEYKQASVYHKTKKDQAEATRKKLDDQLKEKARNIKNDATKYNFPTYTITSIRQDIESLASGNYLLTSEKLTEKEHIIHEDAKMPLAPISIISPQYISLSEKASTALSKVIKPSESIQELLADPRLQAWVREGISHHKDKRETCAFCSNSLPSDLWERFDAHFSRESEELRAELKALISAYDTEIRNFKDLREMPESAFYTELKTRYHVQHKHANELFKNYRKALEEIKTALSSREDNIFKEVEFDFEKVNVALLTNAQDEINVIIDENNKLTDTVGQKKSEARKALRLHTVHEFIDTIKYDDELATISSLEEEEKRLESVENDILKLIKEKKTHIHTLKSTLSDERKGAEQVNQYLRHYFGHNSLTLAAEKDTEGSKFVLMRGTKKASNLSEGECSLVAFCYFMAKLSDPGTNAQNTIIWIDDPISSLDSNHIFFAFSLIESILAQPKNYRQLFISTHSLDFLKYLKRITHPYRKENNKRISLAAYFLLENDNKCSRLLPMPKHLKNYTTEFNYLFDVIYKCAQNSIPKNDFDYYYNFGNNMRKFLEAYLFYRYPNHEDTKDKIKKFFGYDNVATALTNRVDNEFSHLEEIFDRSTTPIDVPEIQKVAKYVLNKIEEVDKAQFDALVVSIQG